MKLDTRRYQSYLLRLWRDNLQGEWRASLQNTVTCQQYFFPDLDTLWVFLKDQVAETENQDSPDPVGEPPSGKEGRTSKT